jgi:hypothetical protein
VYEIVCEILFCTVNKRKIDLNLIKAFYDTLTVYL